MMTYTYNEFLGQKTATPILSYFYLDIVESPQYYFVILPKYLL